VYAWAAFVRTGNSRVLKVIKDEANNQIELACLRAFKSFPREFSKILEKMEETAVNVEKAKARHDVVIRHGFGMPPHGRVAV